MLKVNLLRFFGGLLAVILVTFSCSDDDDNGLSFGEQLKKDTAIIKEYLAENGIEADSLDGVWFVVHTDTVGEQPQVTDDILVNYKGKLLSTGEVFDEGQAVTFNLSRVILGWQIVLQEQSEGSSVTLYIPSGYAYGTKGAGSKIPPNANLIFDIDLIEVK